VHVAKIHWKTHPVPLYNLHWVAVRLDFRLPDHQDGGSPDEGRSRSLPVIPTPFFLHLIVRNKERYKLRKYFANFLILESSKVDSLLII
jgi:hypothetical protein